MNPAKRAKLEADLGKDSADAIAPLYAHFQSTILSLLSSTDSHQNLPVSVDMKQILEAADAHLIPLAFALGKHQGRLGKGEYFRIDLSALPSLCLRLLKIQAGSVKADRCSPALFASLQAQLPLLHTWTVAKLVQFGEEYGTESLLLFGGDLKDVTEYCLQHGKFDLVLPLLAWIWSVGPSRLFLELRKTLGKPIATALVQAHSKPLGTVTEADLLMALLACRLLSDSPGSGAPLSLADTLFELLVDRLMALSDSVSASPLLDAYMSKLVECLVAGSIASIPAYLSPRCALVIRLVGMLSVFPHAGPLTRLACDEAQLKMEMAIHPVRPLAPVELGVRRARLEAIRASQQECMVMPMEEVTQPRNEMKMSNPSSIAVNVDALMASAMPAVTRTHRPHDQSRPTPVEEEPIAAPSIISAPNLFAAPSINKPTEAPEADEDEPLPDLFLD